MNQTDTSWMSSNQKNIRYISEAYALGRLSHAYIIEGMEGSGKESFADYIAAALLCDRSRQGGGTGLTGSGWQAQPGGTGLIRPCGQCPSCIKAMTGNHPDIIHVQHEKDTVLSVGEIREQVVGDIDIKPYYGPYKIYVIPQAQLMNENAQNALLKTIEEPQPYGVILLLTDNADGFLQTIRSRCIRLHVADLPRHVQVQRLMDEDGQKVLETLRQTPFMTASDIYKAAKLLDPMDSEKVLAIFQMWCRDLLVYKSTGDAQRLYFGADPMSSMYMEDIRRLTDRAGYEQLQEIRLALQELNTRIHVNVKAEAAYETFLIKARQMLN